MQNHHFKQVLNNNLFTSSVFCKATFIIKMQNIDNFLNVLLDSAHSVQVYTVWKLQFLVFDKRRVCEMSIYISACKTTESWKCFSCVGEKDV